MSGWPREDAIAMEQRHILEGEKMIAKQEALVRELAGRRGDLARSANEVLDILRKSLEFSRNRLHQLQAIVDEHPKPD